MVEVLTSLRRMDINQLYLHEEHEPSRLHRTSQLIQHDGFLRHPVLVTQMRDGRFLVLDGAHRIGSLKLLGCSQVPVQIARKSDFRLEAWHHVVGADTGVREILQDSSLSWLHTEERDGKELADQRATIEFVDENGRVSLLQTSEQQDFLDVWHHVVSTYNQEGAVKRVPAESLQLPDKGMILIKYKAVSFDQLEQVMMEGRILPAGVTRFQVNGRLLNLKVPLRLLHENLSDDREWEELHQVWNRSLRLYTEQIYLCEI